MDERRVADYFVVAGLPDDPSPNAAQEFMTRDGTCLKSTYNQAPITDVVVIFPSLGEENPEGFIQIWTTPTGHPANLNHGSLRSPSVFVCYRRGWDRPPLVDVGVYYEGGKENVMSDVEVVSTSVGGRPANVNNSGSHVYITYRRASETDPCNILVVTDICVILENKDEKPPHTFCKIPNNLNKGLLGSDVFLCYKKSMNRVNSLSYKPETLARFPLRNYENFPLPDSVPLFCLPMGANVECWPAKAKRSSHVFSTFVLTVSVYDMVEKVYGTAITFYESYSASKLTSEEKVKLGFTNEAEQTVHVNKCLCILSRWPFFDTFQSFLKYLYDMSVSGTHSIPIERYISHFMQEVPFPSPQRPQILVQLDAQTTIALAQPVDSPLPLSGASFKELLKNLGPDNCMIVLLYALTEQKILVHSLRPDVLTSIAEAISMFIFPFHWQCPYIPLCPLGLSDLLSAPMPYIVGVDSRYFDLYDPPSDVFCIDLDTVGTSSCEEKKFLNVKLFPKKPARILRNTLATLFEQVHQMRTEEHREIDENAAIDRDFKIKKQESLIDVEIQEAFLRFMATILKGFRSYLLPITRAPTIGSTDPNSLFDIHGFIKSRDKSYHRFYHLLMKTQMFTRFIEERSFVTDKDASLAFFDECTEKMELGDGRDMKLLEPESYQSERTVFVPPPDMNGLSLKASYSYKGVLRLDPTLYYGKDRLMARSLSNRASPAPNSPLARRTKQEIRSAQKLAKKQAEDPYQWSRCLLSYSYSLWFIHLPAFVKESNSKSATLSDALNVLIRMQGHRLKNIDEVCYRVLMQLCGQYGEPILAIKIYSNMKNNGVQPNAITYGYYNKAVLENKWPSSSRRSGVLWRKLRNVIFGVSQFRQNLAHRPRSTYSESDAASSESGVPDDILLHPGSEDRGSMGGQSDVGYSSMNLDETQKSSSSINSGSEAAVDSEDSVKKTAANGVVRNFVRNRGTMLSEGGQSESHSPKYNSVDFSESNEFRSRVGSIVRNPVHSLGKLNNLRENTTVDSSAGLLISGHLMLDDVFVDKDGEAHVQRGAKSWWKRRHRSCDISDVATSKNSRYNKSAATQKQSSSEGRKCCQGSDDHEPRLLLRSGSFACDDRILSHLSQDDDDEDEDDDILIGNALKKETEINAAAMFSSTARPKVSRESSVDSMGRTSGITSPQLTPVTQNDPLGVFSTTAPVSSVAGARTLPAMSRESPPSLCSSTSRGSSVFGSELLRSDPKRHSVTLGRSRAGRGGLIVSGTGSSFARSASFCDSPSCHLKGSNHNTLQCGGKVVLHRSSTVPDAATLAGNVKNNTMSPLRSQLSSLTSRFQTLGSRKSETLLFGGFHGLKTAANSVASKLSEIKEAISTTSFASVPNTPNNSNPLPKPFEMEKKLLFDDDLESSPVDGSSRRSSFDFRGKLMKNDTGGSTEDRLSEKRNSCGSLDGLKTKDCGSLPHVESEPLLDTTQSFLLSDSVSPPLFAKRPESIALEIQMTTCSRCHFCSSLLYDEEIMASWTHEDSNLNTRCAFCNRKFVPLLTVNVKDYRTETMGQGILSPAQSTESMHSGQSTGPSRKTSVSHIEPHIEDNPDHESLVNNISSPVDSPCNHPLHKSGKVFESDSASQLILLKIGGERLLKDPLGQSTVFMQPGSLPSSASSSTVDICANGPTTALVLEPISVPYLSPIVLRKELETVLEHEGDMCLTHPNFVDDHPIIFWNLLWFCKRINVPTHLHGLCLKAMAINKDRPIPKNWALADFRKVLVRCMWDNPKLHEKIGPPMYTVWASAEKQSSLVHALVTEPGPIAKGTIEQIISDIRCNDLNGPLKIMLNNLLKKGSITGARFQHHSIYRDLLFLTIAVFGQQNVVLRDFESNYRDAFSKLSTDQFVLNPADYPLSNGAVICRAHFTMLQL